MTKAHPEVTAHFKTLTAWKAELKSLRKITRQCGLTETWKWRQPCYTHEDRNIAILGAFKNYCAISFFNGSLLKNEHGLLLAPGKDSQFTRMLKFTSGEQIAETESIIRACIAEAIQVEASGRKVQTKSVSDYEIPDELRAEFANDPVFQSAFESLTPGRQKGYLLHFAGAKQSKSRAARIAKYRQRILDGKGMRDCICGHSAKYPNCDGSHARVS